MKQTGNPVEYREVRVWDLPVRLFHWTLLALVAFSVWSGAQGGNMMTYHLYSGFAILALVVFRVIWGFVGSRHARFASFLCGPSAVIGYARTLLRGETRSYPGHNPLGGLSALLMLAALSLQAGTGLFANDDIFTEGPLYRYVSKETSDFITALHHYNFYLLAAFVALHVGAVLFYLLGKGENLVRPMVSGRKRLPPDAAADEPFASGWLAAALFAASLVAVYFLVGK